ncbi:hypothetical protein AWJ20_5211 [Sugiyamaella lignohabitans]|uniref:Uncharacterized protein n=1 Tax=Sugiyamaella lignohabitans TaxID=796027 RepID=A0A161HFF5_9ASCO|nr:uncharacterized protein AWJ20_5211 [Sugiyamaella lignohabitans]ANB14250.1 hypothetical protein AWJ20_5211 [Sugiyamaella lignohabitans]
MGSGFSMLSASGSGIDGLGLKPPKTYGIQQSLESKRKLDFYLKGNHFNYNYMFNNRKFHNHLPHALVSAYFLGASPKQLEDLYEDSIQELVQWTEERPSEVTDDDWTDFFGRKNYDRAYFDYFTDKISESTKDWKVIAKQFYVDKYQADGEQPNLLSGLYSGLLHPLIHFGYAIEVDSPLIAIEALAMSCTEYNDLGKLLVDVVDSTPGSKTTDPVQILQDIRNDTDFDNQLSKPFENKLPVLIKKFDSKIKHYSERLDVSNPKEVVLKLLHAGTLILTTTHQVDKPVFDFFLLHILTSSHEMAEIILSPERGELVFPERFHSLLVKQLWTITVILYISQLRPLIKPEILPEMKEPIEDIWKRAIEKTLSGPQKFDSHSLKAVRAMLAAELLTKDTTGVYARAASHFANNKPDTEYGGRTNGKLLLDVKV